MKAVEIVKLLKILDDRYAIKVLEDIFISGYISGIKCGYDNATELVINNKIPSGQEFFRAKQAFKDKYL